MVFPMRRAWIEVAGRLGFQKSGTRRLSEEVRTCEYEDVRVMWEILSKNDPEIARCAQDESSNDNNNSNKEGKKRRKNKRTRVLHSLRRSF